MSIEETIAIVEVYVHHMTGEEVSIRPQLPEELPLLMAAYSKAIQWIHNNNIKLTLLT